VNVVQRLWRVLVTTLGKLGSVMATALERPKKSIRLKLLRMSRFRKTYKKDSLSGANQKTQSEWAENLDLPHQSQYQTKKTIHGVSRPTEWYEDEDTR